MREMPESLEAALEEAGSLESIEQAQQGLQQGRRSEALPVAAVEDSETPQANALLRGSALDRKVDELAREVKRLTTELQQLCGAAGRPATPQNVHHRELYAGTVSKEGTCSRTAQNRGSTDSR